MKKSIILAATLAALSLAGCQKSETVNQNGDDAISFDSYIGRDATKAYIIGKSSLQSSSAGFGVFAYYTPNATYSQSATPNFMYNQQVAYNSTSSKWTYSPAKYWPNNDADLVTFFAYAPFNETHITAKSANTAAGDPTLTFGVDDDIADQVDLLVADASTTTDLTKQTTGGAVKFQFQHVLARVGLKVQAVVDEVNGNATGEDDDATHTGTYPDDATVVSVSEVKMTGTFSASGTVNMNTRAWTPATAAAKTYTWSTSDMVEGVYAGVTTSLQDLTADGNYLMMIPQGPTGMNITVTYKVKTTDSNLANASEVTNVVKSSDFNFTFEAGKAYTFNLHLGLTSVKFDVDVADWSSVTPGTVVNVPINTEN